MDNWEPRTDLEMLRSLLQQGEGEHLDFKLSLDLGKSEGRVNFAKDVVALANTHPGGHLVIGVNDDGSIPPEKVQLDPSQYDSAKLRDCVSKYIEAPIDIRTQIHNVNGSDVLLIAVSPGTPYPIPMSQLGNCQVEGNPGKQRPLFRPGDVYLREGSQNVSLRYGHWERLLATHNQQIRDDVSYTIDSVIQVLAKLQINASGNGISIPLSLEMSYGSLGAAIASHLAGTDSVPVEQLIRQALHSDDSQWDRNLTVISISAIQALAYDKLDLVSLAIDCLFEMHERASNDIKRQLEALIFLYIIGAAAVRYTRWSTLLPMVLRGGDGKHYRSWIRKTQVNASHAELFPPRSGLMIDKARALMNRIPELRPDIEGQLPLDNLQLNDAALNSLCQFDFIQVLIQELVPDTGRSTGYPACAIYSDKRIKSFANKYALDPTVRRELTHQSGEEISRKVFTSACELVHRASTTLGYYWDNPSQTVENYIRSDSDS